MADILGATSAVAGITGSGCLDTVAPVDLLDPICHDGEWIDLADLNDPAFWACGKAPPDLKHPMCNFDTGVWQSYVKLDGLDDLQVCGALPVGDKHLVCNHDTNAWMAYKAPNPAD